jgi:hypothetical protein
MLDNFTLASCHAIDRDDRISGLAVGRGREAVP